MNLSELLRNNHFLGSAFTPHPIEEEFVADWENMLAECAGDSPWEMLREMFVELNFPVREGMSKHPAYLDAKRKGLRPEQGIPSPLRNPSGVEVYLYPTAVGRVPVIEALDEEDFLLLLRSIGYRNEPAPIPGSMGAAMLDNYVNWNRVERHKKRFLAQNPFGDWPARFRELREKPASYRDSILLLSGKEYSGVSHQLAGLDEAEWRRRSLLIRRDHEISHYMTKRYYGVARNHIHDELIADYFGITAAFGDYLPDLALLCLGLESSNYRRGGRLENYYADCELTERDFTSLCDVCRDAVRFIDSCHRDPGYRGDRTQVFHALCQTRIFDMQQHH